jgi:hypothetical protein
MVKSMRSLKMNRSLKKALYKNASSDFSDCKPLMSETNNTFEPRLTSSPFKNQLTETSECYYGENNLNLSVSKVLLEATTINSNYKVNSSKYKKVETRRGTCHRVLSNNNFDCARKSSENENLTFETLYNANSNNPFCQPSKLATQDTIQDSEFRDENDTLVQHSDDFFQSFQAKLTKCKNNFYLSQKVNFEFGKSSVV